jgi:drug/metabolite transporter (DMT)-like permease
VLTKFGYHTVIAEWQANWFRIAIVGILMLLSYMLVLLVYSIARVSYAGAIREISIVFAALLGWRWLSEDFGLMRLVGAILIFAGILVIALAG